MRGLGALVMLLVVSLLLRSTALTALAARGVVLDVLAFATVLWALRNRETWGSTFGFVLGLAADLDAAHWMGRHALILALIGYAVGRMSRTLVRDSGRAQAVLLLAATVLHQVWVGLFELGGFGAWGYLLGRVVLAALATTLAGTALIAVLRLLGRRSLLGHGTVDPDPAR